MIGEKDENSNINPNTIRFILKIGTEYKFTVRKVNISIFRFSRNASNETYTYDNERLKKS